MNSTTSIATTLLCVLSGLLIPFSSLAQVQNNVLVNVGANTQVHVFEEVTNEGDLDIDPSATLHVYNTLNEVGSSPQNLNGHVIIEEHLVLDNSSGLTVAPQATVEVYTALDLENGHVTANAPVIMKSTPAKTAYVDDFSIGYSGTYLGDLTMERYVATGGFHHMGGAVDVTDISSQLSEAALYGPNLGQVIPLASCDPDNVDGSSPYGNLFEWHEDAPFLNSCYQSGWFVRSNGALENGRGYSMTYGPGQTFDLTGPPHLGAVSYGSLGNTNSLGNGFHLVSNPYPCDIEYDQVPSGFDGAIYIWQSSGTYAGTYQASLPGFGTRIASQQGFFVRRSSGSGNYSVPLSSRRTGSSAYFRMPLNHDLVVEVSGIAHRDRTAINFEPNAGEGFNPESDALKLPHTNGQPMLATKLGGEMYSIASIDPNLILQIPLYFTSSESGIYSFEFEANGTELWLEDKKEGYYEPLPYSYEFDYEEGEDEGRFFLHTREIPSDIERINLNVHVGRNRNLVLTGNVEGLAEVNLINMMGQLVWTGMVELKHGTTTLHAPDLSTGVYQVEIKTSQNRFSKNLYLAH